MNPITQRSNTPGQQNGSIVQGRSSPRPDNNENDKGDHVLNERLLFLLANAMASHPGPNNSFSSNWCLQGQVASVTVKNGDTYSGLFFGALMDKPEPEYLLKMVQHTKSGRRGEINGVRDNMRDYVGVGDDHAMSFKIKEVADLAFEGISISSQDRRSNG